MTLMCMTLYLLNMVCVCYIFASYVCIIVIGS